MDPNTNAGPVVLFINQFLSRDVGADPARVASLARFARSIGADTITIKIGEGVVAWFSVAEVEAMRAACVNAGCGFIPFWYSLASVALAEPAVMAPYAAAKAGAGFQLDMEDTWNGQDARAAEYAQLLATHVAPHGPIYISTWADPAEQGWDGVIHALAPVVSIFAPQEYSTWLAWASRQEYHADPARIEPQINLDGGFGPNDPVAIARQARADGHKTIWLWEYNGAEANTAQAKAVIDAFRGTPPPPPPAPTAPRRYIVRAGDTLAGIAARFYGNPADYPRIVEANRGLIIDPDLIQVGWDLIIP